MERGGRDPGVRTRYGVIALTPGNTKVALVRLSDTGAWQFPSVLPGREVEPLGAQLDTALSVAKQQLGLDVTANLCSQPVIHALGPEPRVSTKFFLAFNVPEAELAPAAGKEAAQGAQAASWEDLQGLLEETADQPLAGNQLVAVLRQLQGMVKRRYEMMVPADDGYQEVAALLSWHEAEAPPGGWVGPAPRQFLEQHCRANKLPAPCFNVFERDRTPARTHFCATCLLPHLGLQLTPDAVYPSPLDAMENSAILAILYLEGALAPDCPLVHFAPAGAMAQVPHAFVTEAELRMDARLQQGGALQQQPAGLQQGEAARRGGDLKRPQQHQQQQQMAAGGDVPGLHPHPQQQQQQQQQPGGPLGLAGDRPLKRLRPDKQPLTIGQALGQIGPGKNPLMALKELCDKCRFPMPQYTETRGQDGHTTVAVALPQAGVAGVTGPPNEDRKQARTLAVQLVMDALWKQHPPQPMPAV